jgi:hypothetical protein
MLGFTWYGLLRSTFLTALTARYRFNRTTGKVYVLRPKKFGGNAVLDWNRVKAHLTWCAAGAFEPGFQHDPAQRLARQSEGGGFFMMRSLLLYWPPLDPDDFDRKGEDFILVGRWVTPPAGLWEYIRRFMEEGMDAVPTPKPYDYRRKGRLSMWQQLWEDDLDPFLREARLKGGEEPMSAVSVGALLADLPTRPTNSMAQWLCYWPRFPKEWNSDCGQKRREKGIGPEEPLRWTAKI